MAKGSFNMVLFLVSSADTLQTPEGPLRRPKSRANAPQIFCKERTRPDPAAGVYPVFALPFR